MSGIVSAIFGDDEEPAPPPTLAQPPQEDPEAKRERERAEERARQERVRAIQEQLATETEARGALGTRTLLGDLGFRTTRLGAG
jgi:hypothetical protein